MWSRCRPRTGGRDGEAQGNRRNGDHGARSDALFRRGHGRWNAALAEGGGQFGAVVLEQERICASILADAGSEPFPEDSIEDYAKRILRMIDLTRAATARGDADEAARMAVDVGRLITEAKIKGSWERHALRGEKTASTLRTVTRRANKIRQDEAIARLETWQAMADQAWAANRHLSKPDVAKHIAVKVGGNPGTIRRKIRRK
jgi:hypothetical protein